MNHIKTKSEEEEKARKDYATVKKGEVVADEKLEATVRELLALRHKMDDDELAASKLKAIIMNAMKHSDTLKSKSGVLLATWMAGSLKRKINYDAIFKKYKVAQADIDANTKYTADSRKFEIEEIE